MSTQFTNRQWRLPNNENKDKQSNYSMDFDGANDYITISNPTELTDDFTIAAWIFPTRVNDSYEMIYTQGTAVSVVAPYFAVLDTRLHIYITGVYETGLNFITANQWQHVAVTRTSGVLNLYRNGVEYNGTRPTQNGTINNNSNGIIGKWYNSSHYFKGQIDAVAIFDYALSASQVTTLYGSSSTGIGNPMSLSPKPVAYYPLGDQDAFNGANYLVPNIAAQEDDGDIATSYSPYALDFDSASVDYIDCGTGLGNSLGTVTSLSVSLWVKAPSTAINDFTFNIGSFSNSYGAINFNIHSNVLTVRLNNNAASFSLNPFTSTDWNNVVFVYDGSSQSNSKLYINGQLQTTANFGSFPSTLNLSGLKTILGAGYNTPYSFDGSISNASIWNASLTSAQVTEIYNEGVPSNLNNHSAYSNLVSWWQLGSNSSFNTNWTVLDEKGSNNGTSSNMGEDAIVDGVGSYANGLSSGMGGDEVIGDAPYSTANALSVNMDVEDRVTDTPS